MISLPKTSRLADLCRHGREALRRSVLLAACIAAGYTSVACISAGGAVAQTRTEEAPEQRRTHFDIPAQSLAMALDAYCAAAGLQMFVDTGSIAGRRSALVRGELTRERALQDLLSGTGLAARFVGDQGFTLCVPVPGANRRGPVKAIIARAPTLRQLLCRTAGRVAQGALSQRGDASRASAGSGSGRSASFRAPNSLPRPAAACAMRRWWRHCRARSSARRRRRTCRSRSRFSWRPTQRSRTDIAPGTDLSGQLPRLGIDRIPADIVASRPDQ